MGGNALKNTETRRYKTSEFEKLKEKLIPLVSRIFNTDVYPLKYYSGKESHGDMDLLVSTPFSKQNKIKETLIDELKANEVYHNSNVYSFDYEGLQIDLILIPQEEFEIAKIFYDYNDLGNLVGKLSHSVGLKFGPEGLKYVVTDEKRIKKYEIIGLTNDIVTIFKVLDLDYERYKKGFNSLDEIFSWIQKSKYFNKSITKLNSLSSDQRHRDKKRKNVLKFQEWAEEKDFIERPKFSRDETLEFIDKNFPKIKIYDIIKKYEDLEKEDKEISNKFNGNIIKDVFGLEGKELGNSIIKFKKDLGDNYRKFILANSKEDILNKFKKINNIMEFLSFNDFIDDVNEKIK